MLYENACMFFLMILKVTPIKRAFGMLRCGFPFYVFTRHPNQEDGMMEKRLWNLCGSKIKYK